MNVLQEKVNASMLFAAILGLVFGIVFVHTGLEHKKEMSKRAAEREDRFSAPVEK